MRRFVFTALLFLCIGTESWGQAEKLISVNNFEFSLEDGTIYIAHRGRSIVDRVMRVSDKHNIYQLEVWKGIPFVLDLDGNVWTIDKTPFRFYANRAKFLTRSYAMITAAFIIADYIGQLIHLPLAPSRMFDFSGWHAAQYNVLMAIAPTIVLSAFSSATIADLNRRVTGGLLDGANYFLKKVASGIVSIRYDEGMDDLLLTDSSGGKRYLNTFFSSLAYDSTCEYWLRNLFAAKK